MKKWKNRLTPIWRPAGGLRIFKYSGYIQASIWLIACMAFFALSALPASSHDDDWQRHGVWLVMFETDGCFYCEAWNEEVGVVYAKTPEGQAAPLRRVDIHDNELKGISAASFTPTFVLLRDGHELGRLTGYISEDFFWGMLDPMLEKNGLIKP